MYTPNDLKKILEDGNFKLNPVTHEDFASLYSIFLIVSSMNELRDEIKKLNESLNSSQPSMTEPIKLRKNKSEKDAQNSFAKES